VQNKRSAKAVVSECVWSHQSHCVK